MLRSSAGHGAFQRACTGPLHHKSTGTAAAWLSNINFGSVPAPLVCTVRLAGCFWRTAACGVAGVGGCGCGGGRAPLSSQAGCYHSSTPLHVSGGVSAVAKEGAAATRRRRRTSPALAAAAVTADVDKVSHRRSRLGRGRGAMRVGGKGGRSAAPIVVVAQAEEEALAEEVDATSAGAAGEEEGEEGMAAYTVNLDLVGGDDAPMGEAEEVELAAEIQDGGTDFAAEGEGGVDGEEEPGLAVEGRTAPAVGSLLDFESPLNLRLATLTRHPGKAFRAIAVYVPLQREAVNYSLTFEDIASGAQLVCQLDEVRSLYFEWIAQFRASFIALFVPTLQHPNATLLQNAIHSAARPVRPLPPPGSCPSRLPEDPDHLFFSYTKLREIVSRKKREMQLNPQLLTVTVLNAYAEEWRNFITAPMSCAPQPFLLAAFNFHGKDNIMFNKELLHAQLAVAAEALLTSGVRRGLTTYHRSFSKSDHWSLIFVSAPARTAAGVSAIPPMQDLLTGQFIEPLTLSERHVVYIIGTGTAAQAFAQFPVARKGKVAFSILLQDVESQLQLQRPHRATLTMMLAAALDSFSRLTWMGLMSAETGELRLPKPPNAFHRLERRTVQREIVPSFLESVFAPSNRLVAGSPGMGPGGMSAQRGPALAVGPQSPSRGGGRSGGSPLFKDHRRLEEHINLIFNNPDRLENEQGLQRMLRGCKVFFINLASANVTAARRADNPFSSRNGIVDVTGQLWSSLSLPNPPPMLHLQAKSNAAGDRRGFVQPDKVIPEALPTAPADAEDPQRRANNAILVAWDVKRVILFLRESPRLREFLYNGGRIWCAQYAQYLLRGFNHLNLATMERTLLQFHDGPLQTALHPLAKLKLIFETQIDVAVRTRQLNSIVHRMDGLLASAEMEMNGLQVAPQNEITRFAHTLRLEHENLEKMLQEKIMDFTRLMDNDVRQRINFRSPLDISTIIYGGALCRHLGSRFVPVRAAKYPITALLPHLVCRVTETPLPAAYQQPESLLGSFQQSSVAVSFTAQDVERSLRAIQQLCKRCSMDQLVHNTAIVVVICRVKMGGLLEQLSLYCPGAATQEEEINIRVAIDDILPVAEKRDLVTVAQLRHMIAEYKPLQNLLPPCSGGASSGSGSGPRRHSSKKPINLRNILILTNCSHERLEPLVDTGVIDAIEQAVLGSHRAAAGSPSDERSPFERVCFADLGKALPPPPQGADTFENDFTELTTSIGVSFSAKANWESHAAATLSLGGLEGVTKALISHCASLIGTPRDAFRNTHPVPSSCPRGLHGQEQASTAGMLWMVTPASLHPVLHRFLRGRSASSGADAMERVTVFLSPYKNIDLSFFTALQRLRFTEKKLQLFEEGCLFRAVLPECNDQVHGELCHCVTATGRLSSQSPNLQNIPKEEDLRRLIRSRFGAEGCMIEADYSQLEVVVLAALSRDPQMAQELRDQVDFHCLRVSLMTKEPYEEVVHKVKVLKDVDYIQLRQQAKIFSFQRQYGAGVATIATTTGLSEQEVDRLITAEEQHYKELGRYYRLVMDSVEAGSDRLMRMRTLDVAQWSANLRRVLILTDPLYYFVVPTGSKFDFAKERKSVPRLKNYPVQGLAGEIVQIMCGIILRKFYASRNYNQKAFLVNTVHDCVWVDAHESVAEQVQEDLQHIMDHTQQVIGDLWPEMNLDVPFKAEIHSGRTLGEL